MCSRPQASAGTRTSALHGDPADRLILITALDHAARLVTRDAKLTDSRLVDVLW